jgi:hypothetical protein
LRAGFSGLFRPFPDSFRQQTGNSVLPFPWFYQDVDSGSDAAEFRLPQN